MLFFGGEETLLAYDLAARGWGVAYAPSVTARHHPAPGGRPGRTAVQSRNHLLTLWLRRPLPVALRGTATVAAAAARREPGAMAALRGTLARLPSALKERTPLPAPVESAARLLDRADEGTPGVTT
ncbi:glycosyltransferase family 2 protein [Streptomyces bluensis]|uniref:glycosyltransferase family 2 protein n=1 Tax=Streptomyces bluensis TaxID=33897 RepID=UPI001677C495